MVTYGEATEIGVSRTDNNKKRPKWGVFYGGAALWRSEPGGSDSDASSVAATQ